METFLCKCQPCSFPLESFLISFQKLYSYATGRFTQQHVCLETIPTFQCQIQLLFRLKKDERHIYLVRVVNNLVTNMKLLGTWSFQVEN